MGTYETLKRAYCRSTGKDEPEVIATLGFGALSGSIGAASVYRTLTILHSAPSAVGTHCTREFASSRPGSYMRAHPLYRDPAASRLVIQWPQAN
jgi:hypothetical protein